MRSELRWPSQPPLDSNRLLLPHYSDHSSSKKISFSLLGFNISNLPSDALAPGVLVKKETVPHRIGTTVRFSNMFHNLPVRRQVRSVPLP